MKINRFQTRIVALPSESGPLTGTAASTFIVLQLWSDDGIEGVGYGTLVPQIMVKPLKVTIDSLSENVIGTNPMNIEQTIGGLLTTASNGNISGLLCHAIAAIDIALWDIRAKAMGKPVHKLLGGFTDRIPIYASGYLWRDYSLDQIAETGVRLLSEGFTVMKLRLGGEESAAKEVERVKILREAVGDNIDIMIDINQGWTVTQAISMGREIEEFGIYWLEDPVAHHDFAGQAKITSTLDIPIASGEYHYGLPPFHYAISNRSFDIPMIDLMRVPGFTYWMKVAHMAEAANLKVASHLAPELMCHAMAAIPNALITEHMPWGLPLFQESLTIKDGDLVLPSNPGLGLTLNEIDVERYSVG